MVLDGHRVLRGGRAGGRAAGLARGGGAPGLFGVQVSGTYWSLRYWLLWGAEQQRQLGTQVQWLHVGGAVLRLGGGAPRVRRVKLAVSRE